MHESPHLKLTKFYWTEWVLPGDIAIDATCGNGHDTLFLAKLPLSVLFAIDIQSEALCQTKSLLENRLSTLELQKVHLSKMSHETWDALDLPGSPHLIVYNLGYLPGADKTVTTKTKTTLSSLENGLKILADRGAVSITCYPGHAEGQREEVALLEYCQSLLPSQWEVRHHRWLNRSALSPTLLWIRRL